MAKGRDAPLSVLVALIAVCSLLISCTTLRDVQRELSDGGFSLWYPAEAGIEPGQIWLTDGNVKIIIQRRPDSLPLMPPHDAGFKSLKNHVEAKMSLDANFSKEILGSAGDISVLLKSASVKDVRLDFGKTTITRLVLGDLSNSTITSELPESYKNALQQVRERKFPLVLITATVETSGMTYTFICDDAYKFQAQAPEIAKAINANLQIEVIDNNTVIWRIKEGRKLIIGISPVSGEIMGLTEKDQTKLISETIDALNKLKSLRVGNYLMDTVACGKDMSKPSL